MAPKKSKNIQQKTVAFNLDSFDEKELLEWSNLYSNNFSKLAKTALTVYRLMVEGRGAGVSMVQMVPMAPAPDQPPEQEEKSVIPEIDEETRAKLSAFMDDDDDDDD